MSPHLEALMRRELERPEPPTSHVADGAFVVGTAVASTAINSFLPVVGTVLGGLAINEWAHRRTRQQDEVRCADVVAPHVEDIIRREIGGRILAEQLGATGDIAAWNAWMPWDELHAGRKVAVPAELGHPRDVGFEHTNLAASVGQRDDWVRSMPDGSRLHAHEYDDDHIVLHRDDIDPSSGVLRAVWHWMTECRMGQVVTTATIIGGLLLWAKTRDMSLHLPPEPTT